MAAPATREKAPGLGILIGVGKGPPMGREKRMMGEEMEPPESEESLDPDVEEYAVQAFPDLEGDTERLMAFQKACRAAMR